VIHSTDEHGRCLACSEPRPRDIGQERADCAETIKSLSVRLSPECVVAVRLGIDVRMTIREDHNMGAGCKYLTLEPKLFIRL
jgi:hypothetical protein